MLHKNDTYDEQEGAGQRRMQWEAEYFSISHKLTPQERALLGMLKDGHTQREIAEYLGCSQPTIQRSVVNLQQKISELGESKSTS